MIAPKGYTHRLFSPAFALLIAVIAGTAAHAQDNYPSKVVEIVVPFTAGGSTDLGARVLADALQARWSSPVRVINQPGGNTVPAVAAIMSAPPVGYSVLMDGPGSSSMLETTVATIPFKVDDRTFLGMAAQTPLMLVVPEESPFKTLADAVAALKKKGLQTILLSGDSQGTTEAVSLAVGANSFEAEVLPEGKADFIRRVQAASGAVAMVGDGVNDAPALAQATLGIALGSGAALAMQAAPVVLMTPSLRRVGDTFELASRTVATVRRNLFWAFAYNVAGITLAVAGVITPLWAAGAMIISSVSVIVQSARLARWEPKE